VSDRKLSRRGYILPKSSFSPKELHSLYRELTLTPFVARATTIRKKIVVYRENEKKIYIPRFWGIEKYGMPQTNEIPEGEPTQMTFTGKLRDHQQMVADMYLRHVEGGGGAVVEVPCAFGKTVMAIYIASVLKTKTIVLVHKEFLMNQWKERLQQFVPHITIGTIRGNKYEVEGKDVVIGMVQTMYSREFGDKLNVFGCMIVDEVHRFGSEEFSKTFFTISPKYILGLSATVDRKDRLTPLLYMFLGPLIYSKKDRDETNVLVRAIHHTTTDENYKITEYDHQGVTKITTMISKVCDYLPRCEFVVEIVHKQKCISPQSQILILAHKLSFLTYLYNAISNFATVGYYKGGMKSHELEESTFKEVILGTYSMASEGMDIRSLTTLILATPKTDIIQCVGRILRETRTIRPTVIDILDEHTCFKKQWQKRKSYYKKCQYSIVHHMEPVVNHSQPNVDDDDDDDDDDENTLNVHSTVCDVIFNEDL